MYYIQPKTNEDLVQWANSLAEIMNQRNRGDVADGIAKCVQQFQQDPFTIAVIGKAKRGKSTLINALMGRHDDTLAPIDKLPASSAITRFRYSSTEKASVFFQDGHSQNISWNDIRNYVTEENNPQNQKEVATVVVEGPIEGLRQHVELVDTPGAGSIHEHHDELLHAFIPQADAVIFIVTAQMPLDQDELDLLAEVKKADVAKVFFVINRVDEIDEEEDLHYAIKHNGALLAQVGIHCETFYQISAKNAFLGKPNHGVDVLSRAIESFLAKERIAIQRRRFISSVCTLVEPELQSLSMTLTSITKSNEELDKEIQVLKDEYRKIEKSKQDVEARFRKDWGDAVNAMKNQLTPAENRVHDRIQAEIDQTGVSQLVKTLPTTLVNTLEEELRPVSDQFESQAQRLCEELCVSYPAIDMDSQSRLTIRPNGAKGAVITTIGGVGAMAGGVALAGAGAAATSAAAAAAAEAAMAATAAGITQTALVSTGTGIVSYLTGNLAGLISSIGSLGTALFGGEAAVTAAGATAAATASAPLWATLAGPIGWTIAGIGVIAIPLAWAFRKSKQKEQIREQVEKKICEVFKTIREKQIPELREMGKHILEEFSSNLESKKSKIEETLEEVKRARPSESEIQAMTTQCEKLNQLMNAVAEG